MFCLRKNPSQARLEHTFSYSIASRRQRQFRASLVYRAGFRKAWATQRKTVSKTKPKQKIGLM